MGDAQTREASDLSGGLLPTYLAGATVYLDDQPAPLLYASEGQINFLIPGRQGSQPTAVRVVREGQTGPEVMIAITEATPALRLERLRDRYPRR